MSTSSGFFSPKWDCLNMHSLLNTEFSQLYYSHCCKRVTAIKKLLDHLPQSTLARLEEINRFRAVYWFLPYNSQYGMVEECPHGRMIYLSQTLELLGDDAIEGAVAHELAHLVQGHLDVPVQERGESTTEKDADETVMGWNLGQELKTFREQSPQVDRFLWREASEKFESLFNSCRSRSTSAPTAGDP